MLVRRRYSSIHPGEVTGYAVGLAAHTSRDGQVIWYGGGKLAADLTLPKLRARWADPAARDPLAGAAASAGRWSAACCGPPWPRRRRRPGRGGVLRRSCARLGVLVRERFSEVNPGEVTGYAVTLPGCTGTDGAPRWYGGGRLHDR